MGVSNSAVSYQGASGLPAVLIQGIGNGAVGLQIDGGNGTGSIGIFATGAKGAFFNGNAGPGLLLAGSTFGLQTNSISSTGTVTLNAVAVTGGFAISGAFTATNGLNDVHLGATQDAASATAWGSSVVGNSRTRDMYLQGVTNKVAFDVPSAGNYTVYASDDTTTLKTGTYTAAAGNPVIALDPA
jgi:hypothetical protein